MPKAALAEVQKFHTRLCDTQVLDPACGTGNFLYVAMEMMKRLEGEVLEAVADLGGQEALEPRRPHRRPASVPRHGDQPARRGDRRTRRCGSAILQWHFRTRGGAPAEPILKDFRTITAMDAVLAHDGRELVRDENGRPVTRTNAEGDLVEVYSYRNPRRPEWPEADYIVGNPPFIGGKDIRRSLG